MPGGRGKEAGVVHVLLKTRLPFSDSDAEATSDFSQCGDKCATPLASSLSLPPSSGFFCLFVCSLVCLPVSFYCVIAKTASDVTSSGPLMTAVAGGEEAELRKVAAGNCGGFCRLPGTFLLYTTSSGSVLITPHFTLLFFAFNPGPLSKLLPPLLLLLL